MIAPTEIPPDPIKEAIKNARTLSTGRESDIAARTRIRATSQDHPMTSGEIDFDRGVVAKTLGGDDVDVDRAPEFSDEAIALRFAKRHKSSLRFVNKWGHWLHFDGRLWLHDDTLFVFDLVRQICREAANECDKPNVRAAIASAKTVAAVERLARSDRTLAATHEQWDADPWLLNTPDGVVDLRTGNLRANQPEDFMSKITAVGPHGDCPRFIEFLTHVTGDDASFVAYLRRVLGYVLTGSTREQALFFLHGKGSNGKSVLLLTIAKILASYHKSAAMETFIASANDRHPTDLAGLHAARLVTATETEDNRRWAESRIKSLTGGDTISARFMRQDYFEFTPAFKLMFAGNHKPSLRSVGEAIRRRFHLLPFTVQIPEEERDLELRAKLQSEWPGILQWMIEGALDWQTDGLRPPTAVIDATAAYLAAEDSVAAWIDEKCERNPSVWTSLSDLFASWKVWAEGRKEPAGSSKSFGETLENHSYTRKKRNMGMGYFGLQVVSDEAPVAEWDA